MRYASRTASGISISGSIETSCWISPIGKIGVRSSGPAGCIVPGLSGGIGSPGRSGSRFTQCVGISDSGSRYFTVSSLMGAILSRREQPAYERRNPGGMVDQPAPGDPDHAVAGDLQRRVPFAIVLEGAAPVMELPAVELDDQPLRRPHGVHEVALDEHVAGRERQAGRAAQVEETGLELEPRVADRARAVGEQRLDVLQRAPTVAAP